jgi:hypothetical protein
MVGILKLARAAINSINNTPDGITPTVVIKLPGKWDASKFKYLDGPKSPQGNIVKEDYEGVYVIFDAVDILAWCVANGAPVTIERKSR